MPDCRPDKALIFFLVLHPRTTLGGMGGLQHPPQNPQLGGGGEGLKMFIFDYGGCSENEIINIIKPFVPNLIYYFSTR